jgi:hypothetical protein
LKMALEYRHLVGITCDGSEGQLSALYEDIMPVMIRRKWALARNWVSKA